jgi:HAD superfamily hydrolase (TIGR01509 family)
MTGELFIRALVFDFDGLTVDSAAAEQQAWRDIYHACGTRVQFDDWNDAGAPTPLSSLDRDPCDQLERQLGERVDRAQVRRQVAQRKEEILANEAPLPGVRDFIDRAGELGLMLGIASQTNRGRVEEHLHRLSLGERFDAIRCAQDVSSAMPDSALYVSVCDALDVRPADSIAVQSSPRGIRSAKGAGLYCISVPDRVTGSVSMDKADLVLVSLATVTLDEVVERASQRNPSSPGSSDVHG